MKISTMVDYTSRVYADLQWTDRLSAKLIKIWDSFSWLITDNWSIVQIDDMLADRFYVSGRKSAQYNNILIDR